MVRLRTSVTGVLLVLVFVLIQNVLLVRPPAPRKLVSSYHHSHHDSSNRNKHIFVSVTKSLITIPTVSSYILKTTSNILSTTTIKSPTTKLLRGDQLSYDDYYYENEEDILHRTIRTQQQRNHQNGPFIFSLNGVDGGILNSNRQNDVLSSDIQPIYQNGYHYRAYRPPQRVVHPCEHSSCYPATGNLLIGRENRLYASSTCGTQQPERFCIVSHLEEKKCFLCDTRPETEYDPLKNHRVGQMIYKAQPGTREQSWWQSENGKENVTVQLDLEAEFHFTHLIIVFATFRPAAMLIERSYDFGRSWHVYKHFAHNCADAFPGVPLVSKNITDVVCDHRYSGVEPSKNGEVIFRVLPPNMNIENPYAEHVQNMLKMTNLRINFTRLHNLGDTLLDDRQEIQEKYYYAISNMIVRGSCSCYGHASRCLPLEGVQNKIDMVHGRCECTHNTKGLNCEECEDFYNDLPWKPALGKQTNACKKCHCNSHATSCHFDPAVYEHSGRVSGGVCDNCQHNTQGQHCEECIPFFYKDPEEDIQNPYICKPCDCDPSGSLDDGICDSITDVENTIEAGSCHCKTNVKGRRCDTCKDGFWNLDANSSNGCEPCTCNLHGTINNSGCNMHTGECTCKRLVTGKDCNQCLPETYGLSDSQDGCSLCNCDPGGSIDNHCDLETGQCACRNHMTGRKCDQPKQNHFIPQLHIVYEAENPSITECQGGSYTNNGRNVNCSVISGRYDPNTPQTGYVRASEGEQLTFTIDDVPRTMPYDIRVNYDPQMGGDWNDATITVIRPDLYDPEGECANSHPSREEQVAFTLPEYETSTTALKDICLEQGKQYQFQIEFHRFRPNEDTPTAVIFVDSISLIPRIEVTEIFSGSPPAENRLREYERFRCNESYYYVHFDSTQDLGDPCGDMFKMVRIFIFNGSTPCNCNPTGSMSKKCEEFGGSCQCKTNVVGRQCEKCSPGTYGFSPEGCKACDCDNIGATNNACDLITGQCNCAPNTYGRVCNQCQLGFWNFPNCQQCECNGHSQTCDPQTGECLSCQDYTTGYNCERCIESYYGNPLLGSEIGCRPCRCPDTTASGHTHADKCDLDSRTNDMVCHCGQGYSGARCDICDDNYFGNPEKPGGVCEPCECSNNVDMSKPGNCDLKTGQCLQCLHDTTGGHCEFCRDGFYGDALQQDCQQCDCDVLGTNSTAQYCDRYTGQCPCLANVKGQRCDTCIANHWKIASGEGCERCNCDLVGAENEQCNPYDGQCTCKNGFGGRQCNQCESNYWGNPNIECHRCDCNAYGSANDQCDRTTGKCVCNPGIGGYKCDECARGYLGEAPYCSACGECFDNWDIILNALQNETKHVIEQAKQIKTVGATGAYTKQFEAMESKLGIVRSLLDSTSIGAQDIQNLEKQVADVRQYLNTSLEKLQLTETTLENVHSTINLANVALDDLRNRSEQIKTLANDLKANATKLQEANVEGALNLTREAWQRVQQLKDLDLETQDLNANAERQCRRTEALVNRSTTEFDELQRKNEDDLDKYHIELVSLTERIPDLNEQMCDKRGDPCDNLCGGAGCKQCGGISCEKGALTKAERALFYVQDTEKDIKAKDEAAEDLIRLLSQAKTNASEANAKSERAFIEAEAYLNATKKLTTDGDELIQNLTNLLNNNVATPNEIEEYAKKTLALELELDQDEIKSLANRIDETVSQLENVETIIHNTRQDLDRVEYLKTQANDAKKRADDVLENANKVVQSLNDADTAQKKAKEAIRKANEDINLAADDLGQIDGETGDAKNKANETAQKVTKMNEQVSELQKNFLKNDLDAKDINKRAEQVREASNNAHDVATQLKNDYSNANVTLTEKAITSERARERAQQLLQRASKITVDTTGKLKELEEMSNLYKSNDKELNDLQSRLALLNEQMQDYLANIQKSADYYRVCTS